MYLDSRDLKEKREELQNQILDSFNETFPQYETDDFENILFEEEEVQSWKEDWLDEIVEITDIEKLEDEVSSSEWDYGITFISEDEFEDYCEELVEDCGYISKDFPTWIEIDWKATANNVKQDYSEVEYQGVTYLFRD